MAKIVGVLAIVVLLIALGFSLLGERSVVAVNASPDVPQTESASSLTRIEPSATQRERAAELSVAPAPKAEASQPPTLTVEIRDADRKPIESAEVWSMSESGATLLGRSNALGVLGIPSVSPAPDSICARADGYATLTRPVSDAVNQVLSFELLPERVVHGRVIDSGGGSVSGARFEVIAWSSNSVSVPHALWDRAKRGDPATFLTRTDESGNFELTRLDPRTEYYLVAGGQGKISSGAERANVGTDFVEIRVASAFGVIFQLQDPDGGSPKVSKSYVAGPGDLQILHPPSVGTDYVCNGLEPMAGGRTSLDNLSPFKLVVFVTGRSGETRMGPFHVTGHLPGYRDFETVIDATPVLDGIQTVHYTLEPTSNGSGMLIVDLQGDDMLGSQSLDTDYPMMQVYMTPEEGHRQAYMLPSAHGPHVIDGIPFGSYDVVAFAQASTTPLSSDAKGRITIGPEPKTIRFDMSKTASIELALDSRHLDREQAGVRVRLLEIEGISGQSLTGAVTVFNFARPPYLIPGLSKGRYLVQVLEPRDALLNGGDFSQRCVVELHDGDRHSIQFSLP